MANSCAEPATFFAPAPRLGGEEVARQVALLDRLGERGQVLDAIPDLVTVLNAERQILFGNLAVSSLADSLRQGPFEGRRLGEFLGCRNAATAPSGCGTGEACRTCGAVLATLGAQRGRPTTEECRLSTVRGDCLDLRVDASPVAWEGRPYVLVVARDISNEKRRAVLERVFFHDVLNTAGGVLGIAQILSDDRSASATLCGDLLASATTLVGEILSQRALLAAENGDLTVALADVPVGATLEAVVAIYRSHPVAESKHLVVEGNGDGLVLVTDTTILDRVLGNLVKNALEACAPGQTVSVGARVEGRQLAFWVHNPGSIPIDARRQVFQRNFSTKGAGRGIGTYSVKLLVERYLGGSVGFTSSPAGGTRFFVSLPMKSEGSSARSTAAA